MAVAVEVIDSREVFGRVDVLVKPVSGSGEMWVKETTFTQEEEQWWEAGRRAVEDAREQEREAAQASIDRYQAVAGVKGWLLREWELWSYGWRKAR
jgi:hypothetical protein